MKYFIKNRLSLYFVILGFFSVSSIDSIAQATVSAGTATTGDKSIGLQWDLGAGSNDYVIIIQNTSGVFSALSGDPAAATLAVGQTAGGGTVVYRNTDNGASTYTTTINSLTNGTLYYYAIYSEKTTGGPTYTYNAAYTNTGNLKATPKPNPATAAATVFTSNCIDQITFNWVNPAIPHNILVFAKPTSAIGGTYTLATDANTYALGSALDGTNEPNALCVYNGASTATVNVNSLATNTTYSFIVFEYDGATTSSYSTGYQNNTPATLSSVANATSPITIADNAKVTVSWTNPTTCFDEIIVAVKPSTAISGAPQSPATYITDGAGVFGGGTFYNGTNSSEGYIAYKGVGTSVQVTGLTNGTSYHFRIFARKGNTWSSGSVDFSDTPCAASNITNYKVQALNASATLTWTSPTCFDKVLIVAKSTAAVSGTPLAEASYPSPNNTYGTGSFFNGTNGTDGYVVYLSNSNTVTVSSLINGTTYFFKAFGLKGASWSSGIELSITPQTIPSPVTAAGSPFTNNCINDFTFNWVNPVTTNTVLVFAKQGGAVSNATPPTLNVSAYTASANFGTPGTAYENDPIAFCVYKGSGTSVNLTGLTAGSSYHFLVYNVNGEVYSGSYTNNNTTLTAPPNISGLTAAPNNASATVAWTNPSACYDGLIIVQHTASIAGTPAGAYSVNDPFPGGGTVVYASTTPSSPQTFSSLVNGSTYYYKIFTYKGSVYSSGIQAGPISPCAPDNVTGLSLDDGTSSVVVTWVAPSCSDEIIIVAKKGSAVSSAPAIGVTYSGNQDYSLATAPGFDAGARVVYNGLGNSSPKTITNLNLAGGSLYYFKVYTRKGQDWSAGVELSKYVGPPLVASLSPANASGGVATNATLSITFNEAIQKATGGSGASNKIVLTPSNGGNPTITLDRDAVGVISIPSPGTGTVANVSFSPSLLVTGETYTVTVGNNVFRDFAGTPNVFAGIASGWSFQTSAGVTVNNLSSGVCNSFTTIGDIIITETANNDFNGNGTALPATLNLVLTLDNGAFAFPTNTSLISIPSFTAARDITGPITIASATFNKITFSIPIGGTSNLDQLTISGLKVVSDGTSTPAHIKIDASSTFNVQGAAAGAKDLATLNYNNTATTLPAFVWPGSDNSYCVTADLTTVALTAAAGTYNWYNNSLLTGTPLQTTGATTAKAVFFPSSPSAVGTYTYYVTKVTPCESAAQAVTLEITGPPTVDAGADKTVANGNTEVCSMATISIGGSPTLQTPSVPGTYTYSWLSTPAIAISSVSNPSFTLPQNSSGAIQSYAITLTVTDPNSCQATDLINVDVKPDIVPFLTQPSSYTFSTNTPAQLLAASPSGGVFSGVGVIQSSPGVYKFDSSTAYDVSQPLPQNFNIYYSVTSGGCTNNNAANPIANFTLSNQLFSTLSPQYCSSERPDNATGTQILLSADVNAYNNVISNLDNWNNSSRFSYAPLSSYAYWSASVNYGVNAVVRHTDNKAYKCALANTGVNPTGNPAFWTEDFTLKAKFNGLIQNYYEGYYGGNSGSPTISQPQLGGSYTVSGHTYPYYELFTNPNYVNCSGCNYEFPAFYLEFIQPTDVQYLIGNYNNGYTYYPGDVVVSGGHFYQQKLSYSVYPYWIVGVTPPNVSYWNDLGTVAAGTFSTGARFKSATTSGFYTNGQYVNINFNPTVFFTGLNSGFTSPSDFCNVNQNYNLQGNYSSGTYKISTDGGSTFLAATGTTLGAGNGLASNAGGAGAFNPKTTFNFLSNPGVPPTIKIQYNVDPGTVGSTAQACLGTQVQTITIQPLPAISLDVPPNPPGGIGNALCYNGTNINITSTPSDANVRFNAYGILDNLDGTAVLNPKNSFDASAFQTGTSGNQSIDITATYTNPTYGCQNTSSPLNYVVKPLSPASFTYNNRLIYCYEDVPQLFQGQQATSFYSITYLGSTTPANYVVNVGNSGSPQANYSFDPKALFDDAVSNRGADPTLAQKFDVLYTAIVSGCTNTFTVQFTVNPKIILDITNISSNQIFCSNPLAPSSLIITGNITGSGIFTSSPDGVTFTTPGYMNNNVAGQAVLDFNQAYIALPGVSGYKDLYVKYTQLTAGCTGSGSITKTIKISDPPTISFIPPPNDNQVFCKDASAITLNTSSASNLGPIVTTISGFGISDLGNGTAKFDPNSAITQAEQTNNVTYTYATRPTINATANVKDGNGCVNRAIKQVIVNPTPPASVLSYPTNLCYTGSNVLLDGQQSSAYYNILYNDVTRTDTFGGTSAPNPDYSFNPKLFFDNAVALGANPLNTLTFNIVYTSFDPDLCLNTLAPVTVQIAPQIIPTMAGITDQEEYCSNAGSRLITLTPNTGNLFIAKNGGANSPTPFVNGQYQFSTTLSGGDFTFTYDVITGNNCLNTATKTIHVFPSPVASFTVSPKCEGDIISYDADGTQNTASAIYDWVFNTDPKTGQNLTYQYVGNGVFNVDLLVHYPPMGITNLVCQDDKQQFQTVGPIPKVSIFKVTDVCSGDNTQFQYSSNIPISDIKWDFGDGSLSNFGGPTSPISSNNSLTTGTNGTPLHTYSSPNPYTVTLTGKTAPINGACTDTDAKTITILRYFNGTFNPISPATPYSMKAINNEDGYWVMEDKNGNSTWEFNNPSATVINSTEKAWVTNASGNYNSDDDSYVNSPCFDMSSYTKPVISLKYWVNTEANDGADLQFSVNGGQNWFTLGSIVNGFSSGQNWYNAIGISSAPGGQSNYGWTSKTMANWALAKHALDVIPPASRSKVRFRIAFASVRSNSAPQFEGFAFNDVKLEERNRTILVENFTNVKTPISSAMQTNNDNFRNFNSSLSSNEIIKIQYHASFPDEDLNNLKAPADQAARVAFYGITQTPKGVVDGYSNGSFNNSLWAFQYFSLRSLDPSPIQLSFITTTPDPNKLVGTVRITALQSISASKYALQIGVIERNVGSEDYVVRKLLPTASGTLLPSLAVGATKDVSFSWELDSRIINDPDKIEVVAFVQELQGNKEIIQSANLSSIPPIALVTGLENTSAERISIYPNPADQEVTIELPFVAKDKIHIKMMDQLGKEIAHTNILPGNDRVKISTRELAGGVYIAVAESGSIAIHKKVLILHQQ